MKLSQTAGSDYPLTHCQNTRGMESWATPL